MADVSILVAGQAATPLDYTVPNAQEILPKTCCATFDGTGAAGAFLPAIVVESDGGIPVAIPIGTEVAAGASAFVSFFPGGRVASTASASTAAWFFAKRETAQTVTTVNPRVRVHFTHIVTSDSSVFTTSSDALGGTIVTGNKAGIYFASAQAGWHPNATYPNSVNVVTDFFGVSVGANSPLSASVSASDPVGEITNVHDAMLAVTDGILPGEISMVVENWDAVNHNLDSAYYMVAYWPNSTLVT